MRKILIVLIIISSGIYADGSQAFELSLKKDIALSGLAAGAFATGYILKEVSEPELKEFGWFDENLGIKLNEDMDLTGDIIGLSTLVALPFLLDEWDRESITTVGVMFLETALLAYGVKDILKAGFTRGRPYNFSEDELPRDLEEDNDRYYSFPSGHTTVAFMAASFSTYVFSKGESDTKYKVLMGGATYSLAATTAILRVASGVHYPTDVLAGAALGTGIGILVPYLHLKLPENYSLEVSGNSIGVSYRM